MKEVSKDIDVEVLGLLGSGDNRKVLGINLDPSSDELAVKVRINTSTKNRGSKTEPHLMYSHED